MNLTFSTSYLTFAISYSLTTYLGEPAVCFKLSQRVRNEYSEVVTDELTMRLSRFEIMENNEREARIPIPPVVQRAFAELREKHNIPAHDLTPVGMG